MDKIFSVVKNYQASDGDGWSNWVGTKILSYNKTFEGAEQVILNLLEEDLRTSLWHQSLDPHPEPWQQGIDDLMLNQTTISIGLNGHEPFELHPIYDIEEIVLLP